MSVMSGCASWKECLEKERTNALWWAAQSPRVRKRLDPYISLLSDRLLKYNYREKQILLPPPQPHQFAGPIKAGTVCYDRPRGQLGLHPNELVKHTGVVGASGSGKTTFGLRLTKSLLENDTPVVVFDVKRTWRSLVEYLPEDQVRVYTLARPEVSPFYHNFLIPPRKIPARLFDQMMTTVGDEVLYGGLGSTSVIKDATESLRAQYPLPDCEDNHFTLQQLSQEVQRMGGMMRQQKRAGEWAATTQRITKELASPPLGDIINVRRNLMEKELRRAKLVIFEMDLFTHHQFTYFITAFLVREYLKRLETVSEELDRVIVIEEAARIFSQPYPQPMFATVLREVREKGIGLMWLTQSASDVNSAAWANTNSLFIFKQISTKDINTVGSAVAFEKPKEKSYITRLGVGEAIVRLPDRYRLPFLIRTDDLKKIEVSDEKLTAMSKLHLKALGAPIPANGVEADPIPMNPLAIGAPPVSTQSPQPSPRFQESAVDKKDQCTSFPAAREPLSAKPTMSAGAPVNQEDKDASTQEHKWARAPSVPKPAGHLEEREHQAASPLANQRCWVTVWPQKSENPGSPGEQKVASKAEDYEAAMAQLMSLSTRETATPISYLYARLGLSKGTGDKVKKKIVKQGLAQQYRSTHLGRITVHLRLTDQGQEFAKRHAHLLEKSLAFETETKRFGGQKSRELGEVAKPWARKVLGAVRIEEEASDGFGGKWDLLCTDAQGRRTVVELVSGDSKANEVLHVRKALAAGIPIVCLCYDEMIRVRIRRYLKYQRIRESDKWLRLITAEEASQQTQVCTAYNVYNRNNQPPSSGMPQGRVAAG